MSEHELGVSRTVLIVNRKGLHARPSGMISKMASQRDADITLSHGGHSANARSIMDLLLLIAPKGSEIVIRAEGPDADAAVTEIAEYIASGFGEPD